MPNRYFVLFLRLSQQNQHSRLRLKCDGTRAETTFGLSAKQTSPFKSAGASVQSTAGSRGVRISGSNAGYTVFRGSVRVLATHSIRQLPLHFPSRASPCAIRLQLDSTSNYTTATAIFTCFPVHYSLSIVQFNTTKPELLTAVLYFPMAQQPLWVTASSFSRLHDHTQTQHGRQDSSGWVTRPTQTPLPDNTLHSQEPGIHAFGGIRIRHPCQRAVAHPRVRPRGQWDRLALLYTYTYTHATNKWMNNYGKIMLLHIQCDKYSMS
jgi:hypothetical protein